MTPFWHWLVHVLGIDQGLPYGHWNWYNLHSGFGGSIYLAAAVGGPAWYYHRTCHDRPMCLRWGKYEAAGGMFRYCHKHHPEFDYLHGKKPTREDRHRMHYEWKKRTGAA